MNDSKQPLPKPTDWDDLYPGRFLKAGQLGDKKHVLTIKSVDLDMLMSDDGAEKKKGVLSFAETPVQIPINKTNGLCLKAMFGRDVNAWPGKRVVLFKGEWKNEPAVRIYGSPDITADINVEIKLPKRKAFTMVMHAPRRQQSTEAPKEQG